MITTISKTVLGGYFYWSPMYSVGFIPRLSARDELSFIHNSSPVEI